MVNRQRIRKEPWQQRKSFSGKPPVNISSSMVHAMRVVRLISIAGLKPRTFKSWANRVISYLNAIPGKYLHIFDNYG